MVKIRDLRELCFILESYTFSSICNLHEYNDEVFSIIIIM